MTGPDMQMPAPLLIGFRGAGKTTAGRV